MVYEVWKEVETSRFPPRSKRGRRKEDSSNTSTCPRSWRMFGFFSNRTSSDHHDEETSSSLKKKRNEIEREIHQVNCKSPQGGFIGEEVEDGFQDFGWVISIPLLKMWDHVWVERHILDQIQNKITNHSYSHLLSHIRKKKTRPHHLGVKQKIWWTSMPTIASIREDGNVKNMDDKGYFGSDTKEENYYI